MGTTPLAQRVVLADGRSHRSALFEGTHHPCLGSGCGLPYSADRGKKSMSRQALDELKQQIPLLDYLQALDLAADPAAQPGSVNGTMSTAL